MPIFFARVLLSLLLLAPVTWLFPGSDDLAVPARPRGQFQLFLPLAAHQARTHGSPRPLLIAFVPDGLARNDVDEAVAIQNTGVNPLALAGWALSDGEGTAVLPELRLQPGEIIWCTRQAAAFERQWAFKPDCEYETDSMDDVPNASGGAPRLGNSGDELALQAPDGTVQDAVIFGDGDVHSEGWQGAPLLYYQRNTRFARAGQVFYRLFDPATLLPRADTDSAADWAQGNDDPAWGRRAAYPGWDLYAFIRSEHVQWAASPVVEILTAPDNTYEAIRSLFANARSAIAIETYEFEHPALVGLLVERAQAGVDVRVLLEGAPTGGLSDDTRWAGQQITAAGGRVHFMVNDVGDANDRYAYQHAKFAIVDDKTLLVSTENFAASSLPPDANDGETSGRRGYAVLVEDPALIARAQAIFQADDDLAHLDIFPWGADDPKYGPPAPGYQPPPFEDQRGYRVRYPRSLAVDDGREAYLFSAPESSLAPGPLLDLIAQAGAGDAIYVQQLYEHPYWGSGASNPFDDPNPRLDALIAAARRGAAVRILLDSYFDSPTDARSNAATVAQLCAIAATENLDLQARLGNPTGEGIHAKLHLLSLKSGRWSVIGSMNGGEVSNKLNRELGLAVRSDQAFDHLLQVFQGDWQTAATATADQACVVQTSGN